MEQPDFRPVFDLLGRLLAFPSRQLPALAQQAQALLSGDAADHGNSFAAGMLALSEDAREELYTASFDITPACVPYAGIHLFGEENFKRGEFMAALNARHAETGFSPNGELPDHVSNLLRFAAQCEPAERRELAQFCLLRPLARMINGLQPPNPYRALLQAALAALGQAYPGLEAPPSPLEQMRQHGTSCAAVSAGCGCGPTPPTGADAAEEPLELQHV